MTLYQLIKVLQEYAHVYGDDHFVVAATENEVIGDIISVGRTNKGETVIVFDVDN